MQTCKKQTHHKGPYDNSTVQFAKRHNCSVDVHVFVKVFAMDGLKQVWLWKLEIVGCYCHRCLNGIFCNFCGCTGANRTRQRANCPHTAFGMWQWFLPTCKREAVTNASCDGQFQNARVTVNWNKTNWRVNYPRSAQHLTKLIKICSIAVARGVHEVACSNTFQLLPKRQVVGRRNFFCLSLCTLCAANPAAIEAP